MVSIRVYPDVRDFLLAVNRGIANRRLCAFITEPVDTRYCAMCSLYADEHIIPVCQKKDLQYERLVSLL